MEQLVNVTVCPASGLEGENEKHATGSGSSGGSGSSDGEVPPGFSSGGVASSGSAPSVGSDSGMGMPGVPGSGLMVMTGGSATVSDSPASVRGGVDGSVLGESSSVDGAGDVESFTEGVVGSATGASADPLVLPVSMPPSESGVDAPSTG